MHAHDDPIEPELDDRQLFIHRYGTTGPPVVLVHGLGASGRSWRLLAERFAAPARFLCPDLLGFGLSPWPVTSYTVEQHLAALGAMLDRANPSGGPVVLAGHSTGSVLALEWAAREPWRFSAVLLISLPVYHSAAEAITLIGALSPLARASVARPHWGELICGVMCAGRPFWRRLMPLLAPGVPADIARDYVLHNWISYSATLQHVLVQHRLEPAATTLAAAGLPVHLLHGGMDTVAPMASVAALAAASGWPLDVLPRAEHHLPVRRPAACAARLQPLVSRYHS